MDRGAGRRETHLYDVDHKIEQLRVWTLELAEDADEAERRAADREIIILGNG
jgi:hypothetical protein